MANPTGQNFLKVLVDPKDSTVDIIAVHGLNTTNTKLHAEAAWTSDNGRLWLRDFLPTFLPNARVLLFGYNANIAFESSIAGIREQAQNLLNLISVERGGNNRRPIVFIAHSLGGIVVKRALVEAQLDRSYNDIRSATHGIAFFGTPHRGGRNTKIGDVVATVVRRILRNPDNTFLEALKKDSLFAESLQKDFEHQLEDYKIISFYETRRMGTLGLVVGKDSATLGLPGFRETQIPLDTDHVGLCKFGDSEGDVYKQVASNIAKLVEYTIKKTEGEGPDASLSTSAIKETDRRCLHALQSTDPRDDKSRIEATKDSLLEDSCSWIFNDPAFIDWWDHNDNSIFWIHGDPGKGKTMMMMALINEISRRLKDEPKTGILSFFFCQNTDQRLKTTTGVLRGLIFMLICQQRTLICHLRKKYDESGDNFLQGPNALYALLELLFHMLRDPSLSNVYLLVDALDECDHDIYQLLERIIRNRLTFKNVKWLMTSRNDPKIKELLNSTGLLHTSLELNSLHVSAAVDSYIECKVNDLTERKKYDDGLSAFVRDYLRQKADGTFLWVALVCKALGNVATWKTKSVIVKFPAGLDRLYERMMEQLHAQGDEEDAELCEQILRMVTLASRPLHIAEVPILAGLPEELHEDHTAIEDLVGRCGSFLTIREAIVYFVHQSAKDYFDKGKGTRIFDAGHDAEHSKIGHICFKLMENTLRRDICHLQLPGTLIEEVGSDTVNHFLPIYTQYACLYWFDHLFQACDDNFLSKGGQLYTFCRQRFLNWLEALSLMGKMLEGIAILRHLPDFLYSRSQNITHDGLQTWAHDMMRFVLKHASILMQAPLQIYASALVFSPTRSLVREWYSTQLPRWLRRLENVEEYWSPNIQTFDSHSDDVQIVVFSRDGRLLASGSQDHTVRLWDPNTGEPKHLLQGHKDLIKTLAFSNDDKLSTSSSLLASGSEDCTIRLWDLSTGEAKFVFSDHTDWVNAVTFSSDGQYLASASDDGTVRVWDLNTGKLRYNFRGHTLEVTAVVFSPCRHLLASGSKDHTVRLWDFGTMRYILEGHAGEVYTVAFRPDGQLLASGSDDCTVRLWNPSTCEIYRILIGHSDKVPIVIFSPYNKLLASSSKDTTIRLWNPSTGDLHGILQGHTKNVSTVAFQPNGPRLASGSHDKMIRIWDTTDGKMIQTLVGHSRQVNTVAFSPLGDTLASGSFDYTVRLWDLALSAPPFPPPEGHLNRVIAVAFSFNGQLLASGSEDCEIRLWDCSKGTLLSRLLGHKSPVRIVIFSPDDRLLASASTGWRVYLWDTQSGEMLKTFHADTDTTQNIAFSPDSQLLAFSSHDSSLQTYNSRTGALSRLHKGKMGAIHTLAFSCDSQQLAYASDGDNTILIWDFSAGRTRSVCEGHTRHVYCLAFSWDGKLLVSGSVDQTIRIWDCRTGQQSRVLLGRTGWIGAVAFSHDNKLIASSGLGDHTIRLWDSSTGSQLQQYEAFDVDEIAFSSDDSFLQTNCGALPLSKITHSPKDRRLPFSPWRLQGAWFTFKNQKALWLPPDLQPRPSISAPKICGLRQCRVARDNLFVLGLPSGQVIFIEFDPNSALFPSKDYPIIPSHNSAFSKDRPIISGPPI